MFSLLHIAMDIRRIDMRRIQTQRPVINTIIVWQHSDLAHCHVSWEAHEYTIMYESLPCAVRTLRGLCALCLYFALE